MIPSNCIGRLALKRFLDNWPGRQLDQFIFRRACGNGRPTKTSHCVARSRRKSILSQVKRDRVIPCGSYLMRQYIVTSWQVRVTAERRADESAVDYNVRRIDIGRSV